MRYKTLAIFGSGILVSSGLAFGSSSASHSDVLSLQTHGELLAYEDTRGQQGEQAGGGMGETQPGQPGTQGQAQPGMQQHEQEQMQAEQGKAEVVTIEFEENQATLTEEAREKIREKLQPYAQQQQGEGGAQQQQGEGNGGVLGLGGQEDTGQQQAGQQQAGQQQAGQQQAGQQQEGGNLETLKVAVWSDQEFSPDVDLPEEAQELARSRAENIENYISEQLQVDTNVQTFNMAERAGILARTFNTEEAELKSLFARRGADEEDHQIETDNPELVHFRDEGGPSKAVMVLEFGEQETAGQTGQHREGQQQ